MDPTVIYIMKWRQNQSGFRNLTAGGVIEKYERKRDELRYYFARMFLGRLWHWISFEAYFRLIHVRAHCQTQL